MTIYPNQMKLLFVIFLCSATLNASEIQEYPFLHENKISALLYQIDQRQMKSITKENRNFLMRTISGSSDEDVQEAWSTYRLSYKKIDIAIKIFRFLGNY